MYRGDRGLHYYYFFFFRDGYFIFAFYELRSNSKYIFAFDRKNKGGGMENMRQMNEKILQVTERIVRIAVEKEKKAWPPICATILHQPMRPAIEKENR